MREGWEKKKLGEVCQLLSGQHIEAKDYNTESRGIGYVTGPSDFGAIHPLISKWTEFPKVVANANDILVTVKGAGVGKINLLDKDNVAISRQLMAIRVTGAERGYIYSFLSSILSDFQSMSTGAAIPGISRDQILTLPINIPPIAEQLRIVRILDEAFDAVATAKANAEKNLQNARAVFESQLESIFTQRGARWVERRLEEVACDFGRGRSRHRPRNDPSLYGGTYPFVQTGDVRASNHLIESYSQTYNEMGLAQSKLWPAGTVCITIAANIAETGVLTFDACFPDSVIGVVVNEKLTDKRFLEYLLQSFRVHLQAQGKGSAQANINMGTFEGQRFPFPPVREQLEIVETLNSLREETQRLASIYERKLAALDELRKSLLHQAFTGQLTADAAHPAVVTARPPTNFIHLQAGVLAMALDKHERARKGDLLTHVKAEKIAHMVEALTGVDLGREPVKDAAGPADFDHLLDVERHAKADRYFEVLQGPDRYRYRRLEQLDELIASTRTELGDRLAMVEAVLDWMLLLTPTDAEIAATVFAAWNNLLLDGKKPTDEEIVRAARDEWHPKKLELQRKRFRDMIDWLRRQYVVPEGKGKRVRAKEG